MVYVMKHKHIRVNEKTHQELQCISKMTNVSMAKIIEEITECMMSLVAGNYPKATFKVMDMVTEDSVIITIHTYGKKSLVFGKSATDTEMLETSKAMLKGVEK
jgi:hypothetical protein